MKYNPLKHHRRSIRLKGYDYHNPGAYFVTICTKNRECLFDDPVVNAIVHDVWYALPSWFPTIELDEFVVMPNHTHFVVWNNVRTPHVGIRDGAVGTPLAGVQNVGIRDGAVGTPLAGVQNVGIRDGAVGTPLAGVQNVGIRDGGKPCPYVIPQPQKINPAPSLGDIVGAFKSLVFTVYLDWIKKNDPSRRAKFWQRNYYEHIIRNDRELNAIRQYIIDNPINWKLDRDNTGNIRKLPPPESIDDYLQDVRDIVASKL
jgi:REP element-mobilizing transposase RayT